MALADLRGLDELSVKLTVTRSRSIRTIGIALAVYHGGTPRLVGEMYGITPNRVHQHCKKFVRQAKYLQKIRQDNASH